MKRVIDSAIYKLYSNYTLVLHSITEQGNLKGILTDRDIALTVVAEGKPAGDIRLQDIMRTNVVTGKPDWDLFEATKIMSEKKVRRLPIASNGRLEGYVSISDIAPVIQRELDSFLELERTPLAHQFQKTSVSRTHT